MATFGTRGTAAREARTLRTRTVGAIRRHRVDVGIMLALLVLAMITISYLRREPVYSDDLGYWERWPRRANSSGMANPYRMTMALSAEIARWVFGHSMIAYNAVGVLYGAALVAMVFVLVRLLFPRPAALGGALLLLSSTVFLQDASLLTPDWPAMFWFTTAFTLLAYAATRREHDRRSALILAAVAGAFIHFGLFARESAILLVLVVPIGMLLLTSLRHATRLTLSAGGSALTFFGLELVWFWRLFDDPGRRVDRILGGHVAGRTSERLGGQVESAAVQAAESGTAEFTRTTLADWWGLAERYIDPISSTLSGTWTLWLIIIALAIVLVSRDRRAWFIAAAAIIGVLGSVFIVGSINPLRPMLSMKYRYLALGWTFLMPMIAIAFWLVGQWIGTRVSRRSDARTQNRTAHLTASVILAGALAAPVFLGPIDTASRPVFVNTGANGLSQAVEAVERLQAEGVTINRIVTDGRTRQGLNIQLRGDDMALVERTTSNYASVEPGDLVIVNRKRIGEAQSRTRGDALPEFLLVPPSNWRHLGEADFADFFVYYVDPPTGQAHEPLTVSGDDVTLLSRASPIDADAQFAWQLGSHGLFVWLEDVDDARYTLGRGWHAYPAIEGDAERLSIDEAGRLGVRVELHTGPDVHVSSMWLRTFDADGEIRQEARMYVADEEGRVSTPQFAIDTSNLRPWSFAASLQVDPDQDVTYRVYGIFDGTGAFTVDRVATYVLPPD